MRTHKPRNGVAALLAIAASLFAIAGMGAAYLLLGHHIGPDRGAFVGIACVLTGVLVACVVLRMRLATGRWITGLTLAVVGSIGFCAAWVLRLAPDAVLRFDLFGIYSAVAAMVSERPSTELWMILGAEVGMLLALSISLAGAFKVRLCHWCSSTCALERDVSRRADTGDTAEIKHRLERHQWQWFRGLGASPPEARSWIRFDLGSCTCGLTRTLRATRVRKLGVDRELVRDLRLKPDDIRVIRGFGLPQEPTIDDMWGPSEVSSVGSVG